MTVVAGSTTPVMLAADAPLLDPVEHLRRQPPVGQYLLKVLNETVY